MRFLAIVSLCLAASACGQREDRLAGQRLDVRAGLVEPLPSAPGAAPFAAPPVSRNADWTHRAGSARNIPIHPALSASPRLAWSVRIGEREGRRHRITADPVVAQGRVFTLDSRSTVAAVSTSGDLLWSRDLTPLTERADDISGGGLATDGARVFVTSGSGRITALDAATGAEIWVQRLGAAATAPPAVDDGVVYLVGSDSRAWALNASTGRIVWEAVGTPSVSGILGGAGPVVTERLILLPFPSAELVGVLKLSGLRVWAAPISGARRGYVYSRITDITGDPVVSGNRVIVGSPAGRTVAVDLISGDRIWTAEDGALGPVQLAGGSVFMISDQNQLLRLNAATGARIWSAELPYFTNRRVRRLRDITDHYGPVLAGGRLYVASGDDTLRVFDPVTGGLIGTLPLPGGAAAQPAVAGGLLYVVSAKGELLAYR